MNGFIQQNWAWKILQNCRNFYTRNTNIEASRQPLAIARINDPQLLSEVKHRNIFDFNHEIVLVIIKQNINLSKLSKLAHLPIDRVSTTAILLHFLTVKWYLRNDFKGPIVNVSASTFDNKINVFALAASALGSKGAAAKNRQSTWFAFKVLEFHRTVTLLEVTFVNTKSSFFNPKAFESVIDKVAVSLVNSVDFVLM